MMICELCSKPHEGSYGSGRFCSSTCAHQFVVDSLYAKMDFDSLSKDRTRRLWLVRERGHQCEVCKLQTWMDSPIPIELDHKDGNPENNKKENLRLICPNCHAQTDTYKGRNVGKVKNSKRQKTMRKYDGLYR